MCRVGFSPFTLAPSGGSISTDDGIQERLKPNLKTVVMNIPWSNNWNGEENKANWGEKKSPCTFVSPVLWAELFSILFPGYFTSGICFFLLFELSSPPPVMWLLAHLYRVRWTHTNQNNLNPEPSACKHTPIHSPQNLHPRQKKNNKGLPFISWFPLSFWPLPPAIPGIAGISLALVLSG